jgi:TetR/AcrR family transcriptional regulator, cholesterol catabolism regulator
LSRDDSSTRQHILDSVVDLIAERGSEDIRVADLATYANVGVPTIYYHFHSRTHLIAEAQVAAWQSHLEPFRASLNNMEKAVDACDEDAFWCALKSAYQPAWTVSESEAKWSAAKRLLDVRLDPASQTRFSELLDCHYERWVHALEGGRRCGWINHEVDLKALVSFQWSASIGQIITSSSACQALSADMVFDLVRSMVAN